MRFAMVALAGFLLPFSGWAQNPPVAASEPGKSVPLSKIERKRKAPVSADVLRVKLPKAGELKLDDGLTVLVMPDHRLPIITVQLTIPGAGSMYDPADLPGLANLTAAMLQEGTAHRGSKQIAEELARLGANLSCSAPFGSDAAVISASGPSDSFAGWVAILADVVLSPAFPEDELKKLKQRRKVQLQQQRSSPGFLIEERFNRAVYGDHPAAVTSATLQSLDAITPDMLKKWHRERYVPQNAILGVAGDTEADALMDVLGNQPEWDSTGTKVAALPPAKAATAKTVYLVDRPGSVQTDVYIGNITLSRTDPDYVALRVMDRVVGGGPAARLFINLREEKGYTYGAYSRLDAEKWAGPWIASGSMRTDATAGAMTEFMKEINRIRDEKVPEAELEEDKRSLVAGFALSLESPSQLLGYSITRKIFGLPEDYWDTYPSRIAKITAEEVQRVARKYLNPDALQIVAVGDAAKIKPVLEKFGLVEVYDVQGKKL